MGTEDWHIQLKQAGLTLEQGAEYEVTMKIKSSAARTVKYAFLTATYDYYGGEDLSLKADEVKEVNFKLTVDQATNNNITFVISMGQIYTDTKDGRIPVETPVSAIEIDDVCVVKTKDGNGPGEEVPPAETGTELIKNGNFAAGKENWTDYVDNAAKAKTLFEDGKARYEITDAGSADWNIQLKQEGLAMEKGASYKVNFKIGASIDRDLRLAFMGEGDAWCGGSDISLTKDKLKSFSQIVTLNEKYVSGTIAFQISLGMPEGVTEMAAHAVEISDVSVTKVEAGTEADPEAETDVTIVPPEESENPGGGEGENPGGGIEGEGENPGGGIEGEGENPGGGNEGESENPDGGSEGESGNPDSSGDGGSTGDTTGGESESSIPDSNSHDTVVDNNNSDNSNESQ